MGAALVSIVVVGMQVVENLQRWGRFGEANVGEGVVERVVDAEAVKDVDCVEMEDAGAGY